MITSDWRYTVGVISGGHFFSHLYILTLPPLFPLMQAEFGWGPAELGLIISVLSAGGLLQPVVGGAVDRIGAKRLIIAGLALTSVCMGLIGTADSLLVVMAFAAIAGIGQSVFHPADYAIMDAVTSESMKGKSFSTHLLAGYIGFAAAPLVVGTIGLQYGWRTALFVVGAVGPVYALLMWFTVEPMYLRQLDETSAETADVDLRDQFQVFFRPATILLFGMFIMATIANKGVQSFTGVLFINLGFPEAAGNTALTAFFVAASVGIVVGGLLADRLPPRGVFAAAMVTASIGLLSVAVFQSSLVRLVAIGLFAVVGGCYGLALPSRDRLVNAVSTAGSTGRTFGFVFAGISLGGVVGPASVGAIIEATSVATGFVVIAAGFAAAVGLVSVLGTRLVPLSVGRATADD